MTKIEKLLELIDEIVNDVETPWRERRDAVLAAASEDENQSLNEFVSWFELEERK